MTRRQLGALVCLVIALGLVSTGNTLAQIAALILVAAYALAGVRRRG